VGAGRGHGEGLRGVAAGALVRRGGLALGLADTLLHRSLLVRSGWLAPAEVQLRRGLLHQQCGLLAQHCRWHLQCMASGPADERAGMSDEEVRRVTDALNAVEEIADEEQRVKAKSRIMADQVKRNKAWAQERTRLIRRLHHGEGLSYRQIAARLDIKLSAVQDAFRNYTPEGEYAGRGGGQKKENDDG
jgi:hypothetical protein